MSIKIIAAHSSNRIIGHQGIPWFIKGELRRFRDITMNHNVVMGRKTYESIGKVLDGRKNIIVSSNNKFRVDGAISAILMMMHYQNATLKKIYLL